MNLEMSSFFTFGWNLMNLIRSPVWQHMDMTNLLLLRIVVCRQRVHEERKYSSGWSQGLLRVGV